MTRNLLYIIIAASCISSWSCIKKVNVETRVEKPVLVVEGGISNDSTPYTVRLTYSGNFRFADDIPEENKETNATVTITDDNGKTANLVHQGDGLYQTTDPAFIGEVGRQYTLTILLPNGTKYVSKPEPIKPVVPIEKVGAFWVDDFNLDSPTYMTVTVDMKDPGDQENYYRWDFDSYIMRETHGIPCGFYCVNFQFCYQHLRENNFKILSDVAINGNEVKDFPVGRCYIYTNGNPYIQVTQYSISRAAYQFFERYKDQLVRTGSILDPLPASIKGNVFNADKPSEFALGYFTATSVSKKKIILVPYGVTDYLLNISARHFIPEGAKSCFEYYPNSLSYAAGPYPPPPPGWETAEQLKVYW